MLTSQVVATINTVVLCYVSTPVNPKQAAEACKVCFMTFDSANSKPAAMVMLLLPYTYT